MFFKKFISILLTFIMLSTLVQVTFCSAKNYVENLGSITVKKGQTECFPQTLKSFILNDDGSNNLSFLVKADSNKKLLGLIIDGSGKILTESEVKDGTANVTYLLTNEDLFSIPSYKFCVKNNDRSKFDANGMISSQSEIKINDPVLLLEPQGSILLSLFKTTLKIAVSAVATAFTTIYCCIEALR